jgi:cell wall-associated NlpC family hydrolase
MSRAPLYQVKKTVTERSGVQFTFKTAIKLARARSNYFTPCGKLFTFANHPIHLRSLMTKFVLFITSFLFSFGAITPAGAQNKKHGTSVRKEVKFLDNINVEASPAQGNSADPKAVFSQSLFKDEKKVIPGLSAESTIEEASNIQLKYALLLDVEVEQALNLDLFKVLDEWIGTRYRLGGTTKDGIDCSALMQILFTGLYGISLPRTAREQYEFSRKLSRAQLKEGDLVFFNTIGGVSHVGMYLQNNKFIHASTGGVTISDLYDEYWMKKFIGVGRVSQSPMIASTAKP